MLVRRTDTLILGAGLQGTAVALELARRGLRVTLMDAEPRAMNRASLRSEAKIHLGFIYAKDRSLASAFLQIDGALRFRAILARWVGRSSRWLALSTPFHYLVAKDSIVAPDRLAEHYAAVEERCCRQLEQDAKLDYLGARPERLVRPLTDREIAAHFDAERFAAGFSTVERAVDADKLLACLRRAIASSPNITFLPSHVARTLTEESDGFRVEGDGALGTWCVRAHQLVNATWERRLVLDQQLGIPPPRDLLHRLKFRVVARLPADLRGAPSVSMVLGRYGDIVIRPDGTAYLSWYPAGLRGWSHDLEPPAAWDPACRGEVAPAVARGVAADMLAGIDAWFPGVARCEPLLVDAGVIVAIGRSDVDDAASGLHDRSSIGVTSRGGYHSLNTGKLTTAPLFAIQTADRVEALQLARRAAS